VLAVCAVAASTAVALPEVGRCAPQAGGRYLGAGCTSKGKGSYEWERNPLATHFVAAGGSATLETASGSAISCGGSVEAGDYVSATPTKEVHNVVIALSGCALPLFDGACASRGAAPGELVSSTLKGKLAYISGKGSPTPVVGLVLSPQTAGAAFREWECPAVGVTVYEGQGAGKGHASVIARLGPLDTMSSAWTQAYLGAKGVQEPLHIEGSASIDSLETSLSGKKGVFERSDQVGELTIANEEALEIKA